MTPKHYDKPVTPWDLQRHMESSGNAFVDSRRADVIEYAFRMKDDLEGDLRKAAHCALEAADGIAARRHFSETKEAAPETGAHPLMHCQRCGKLLGMNHSCFPESPFKVGGEYETASGLHAYIRGVCQTTAGECFSGYAGNTAGVIWHKNGRFLASDRGLDLLPPLAAEPENKPEETQARVTMNWAEALNCLERGIEMKREGWDSGIHCYEGRIVCRGFENWCPRFDDLRAEDWVVESGEA